VSEETSSQNTGVVDYQEGSSWEHVWEVVGVSVEDAVCDGVEDEKLGCVPWFNRMLSNELGG